MKVGNLAVSGEKGVTQQESKAALLENQRRERVIIRTSWVGIVTNVLLALCKAGVGVMSNSIAVLMSVQNWRVKKLTGSILSATDVWNI